MYLLFGKWKCGLIQQIISQINSNSNNEHWLGSHPSQKRIVIYIYIGSTKSNATIELSHNLSFDIKVVHYCNYLKIPFYCICY